MPNTLRHLNELRAATMTVKTVAHVTELTELKVANLLERGLIADVSGKLLSIEAAVQCAVIERVGGSGATLLCGMLAAAPALLRLHERLSQRTLGTHQRLQVMVYHFDRMKSRGRGYSPGRTSISPAFCTLQQVPDVLAARMNDHAEVQQILAVDNLIEDIIAKLPK